MPYEVQCPNCRKTSKTTAGNATQWDCPACKRTYVLRRCSGCSAVSYVGALLPARQPWTCVWCQAVNTGFRPRNDPAAATVADLARSVAERKLELPPLQEAGPSQQVDAGPMLIVTTNEIPGYRITKVHGDVFGLTVRVRDAFTRWTAGLSSIVGGEVSQFTQLLTDSRNQARQRLWQETLARGGNAVVGMRFDCNEIGGIMSEIAAYGTAVTVEPAGPASAGNLLMPQPPPTASPNGF
jgi:uncharacterized protein YbjQ (UPF0145 family)